MGAKAVRTSPGPHGCESGKKDPVGVPRVSPLSPGSVLACPPSSPECPEQAFLRKKRRFCVFAFSENFVFARFSRMDFLAVTRLFLHVTLVVDLRERDVLQPLFFGGHFWGGSGGQRGCSPGAWLCCDPPP